MTFVVLLIIYMWEGVLQYLPTEAFGSFAGILVIFALAVLLFYHVSKNKPFSYIIGFVGVVVMLALYITKSSIYDGLLYNILSSFSVNNIINNFAYYSIFDFKGLFMYLSLAALFIFLTIQSIQKRRWS